LIEKYLFLPQAFFDGYVSTVKISRPLQFRDHRRLFFGGSDVMPPARERKK
jgi:hypothetical protein